MHTQKNGCTFTLAVDESQLSFRSQVYRLLRKREGADATSKFQPPLRWLKFCVLNPFRLPKKVRFYYTLI